MFKNIDVTQLLNMNFSRSLCLIFLLLSLTSSNGQSLTLAYSQSIRLTGNLTIIEQGVYNLNGNLKINAEENSTHIKYSLEYSAILPIYEEQGEATFFEDKDTKLIVNSNKNQSESLSFIWDLFALDNVTVYSLFHITDNEIVASNPLILNYTQNQLERRQFISPELNSAISAYHVQIKTSATDYDLFYDTDFGVLLGFAVELKNDIIGENMILKVIGTISTSTLDLPVIEELTNTRLILAIAIASGIIILSRLLYYFLKRSSGTTIKGGLGNG